MAFALSRKATRTLQVRLYSFATRQATKDRDTPVIQQAPKLTRLSNGLTVASIENQCPVSRVALVANAGCRFEDGDNLGVTHCLRLASNLSTQNCTSFGITRTLEQAGSEFTCSSTREYMFYKIDCLRDHLDLVSKVLMHVTTEPVFKPWELADISDALRQDLAILKTQPNVLVYDLLHQAAFRTTVGRSLYAPDCTVGSHSPEQLLHHMKAYFSTGRLALVGVGVDHIDLLEQAAEFNPFSAATIAHDKAKYYGGEIRVDTGDNLAYAAVAFEGPSLAGNELLHAAVLQNVLGVGPSLKYSTGSFGSPLAQAVVRATSQPFAVTSINANYTDCGMFGFYAISTPREMDTVVRAAYAEFDRVARGGVSEQEVAKAKKQLKAQIAMYRESGEALLYDLGEQALGSQEILTTPDLLKFVDSVNTSDVTNMGKKLTEGKPSMAAMGNLSHTPYLDSLIH